MIPTNPYAKKKRVGPDNKQQAKEMTTAIRPDNRDA